MKILGLTITSVVLLMATSPSAQPQAALSQSTQPPNYMGVDAITDYFDMLASGNMETAQMMWTSEAQERSSRFGIEYIDIPLKVDCGSPIVRNLDVMINYLVPPVKTYNDLENGAFARMLYSSVVGSREVEHHYYVKKGGDWYWLCYPQDYYANSWPVVESRYFRVHVHPDRLPYVHNALLETSDVLLEKLALTLKLPKIKLDRIALNKIEFFYCGSDKDVEDITGKSTWGTIDLASNDIISASFPHLHELAHLLINMKLQKLHLYTLPLIREGAAVCYGGRWGKDAEALMDLAAFLYRQGLVELDSVLTYTGFEQHADIDIAYPVVGLFITYLVDELGQDRFIDLYKSFTMPMDSLARLTTEQIQASIAGSASKESWPDVLAGFDQFIDSRFDSLADAAAGVVRDGRSLISDGAVTVREDGDWVGFEFSVSGNPAQGSFCFVMDDRMKGKKSALFDEHFGDRQQFDGYRYAVRFDQNEAGLYDYASNRLLAKFIAGISAPGDYINSERGTITIKFRRHLLGDQLPAKEDFSLLSE